LYGVIDSLDSLCKVIHGVSSQLLIGMDDLPDAQGAQGNRSIGYKNLDHQYTLKVEIGFLRYNIKVGLRAFVLEKQAMREGGDKLRCIWSESQLKIGGAFDYAHRDHAQT